MKLLRILIVISLSESSYCLRRPHLFNRVIEITRQYDRLIDHAENSSEQFIQEIIKRNFTLLYSYDADPVEFPKVLVRLGHLMSLFEKALKPGWHFNRCRVLLYFRPVFPRKGDSKDILTNGTYEVSNKPEMLDPRCVVGVVFEQSSYDDDCHGLKLRVKSVSSPINGATVTFGVSPAFRLPAISCFYISNTTIPAVQKETLIVISAQLSFTNVEFPKSTSLFEEYLSHILPQSLTLKPETIVLYRLTIFSWVELHAPDGELKQLSTTILRYINSWATKNNRSIVIDIGSTSLEVMETFLTPHLKRSADTVLEYAREGGVIPYFSCESDLEEGGFPCDKMLRLVLSTVGTDFSALELRVGGLSSGSDRWCLRFEEPCSNVSLTGVNQIYFRYEQEFLEEHKFIPKIEEFAGKVRNNGGTLMGIFLLGGNVKIPLLRKLKTPNSTNLTFGCVLKLGEWWLQRSLNLVNNTNTLCHLSSSSSGIRIVVWEWQLSWPKDTPLDSSEDVFELLKRVVESLNELNHLREDIMRKWRGVESVIFSVVPVIPEEFQEIYHFGPMYCSDIKTRMEQLSEVIYGWASSLKVPLMLNPVVRISMKHPSWFYWLSNPYSNLEGNQKEILMKRSLPATMSSDFAQSCFHMEFEPKRIELPGSSKKRSSVGATVDMSFAGRQLEKEELQVLLQLSLRRFHIIFLIFGGQPLKEMEYLASILDGDLLKSLGKDRNRTILFQVTSEVAKNERFLTLVNLLRSDLKGKCQIHLVVKYEPRAKLSRGPKFKPNSGRSKVRKRVRRKSTPAVAGIYLKDCSGWIAEPTFPQTKPEVVVCQLELINTDLDKIDKSSNVLERILYLRSVLAGLMRNETTIYFAMGAWHSSRLHHDRTREFLSFINVLVEFARANDVNLLIPAFDSYRNGVEGWWRVENGTNLATSETYVEKQAEYFGELSPISKSESGWNTGRLGYVIIGVMSLLLIIFVALAGVFAKVAKKHRSLVLTDEEVREFREGYVTDYVYKQSRYLCQGFSDKFEICKKDIKIDFQKILGSGNFGSVYMAVVRSETCAVKVPREACRKENFKSLLAEVKIMSGLEPQENVVRFIGAYTKNIGKGVIYVATELCKNGSLLDHLIKLAAGDDAVEPHQLIRWSFQVASGMEFISTNDIVHGDLSARNVLLDEHYVCKIGDFGMSRVMDEYKRYMKTSNDPLPWKWMSLESLERLEFTSQSDVWSYGVTIWEIFSLGASPYPGLSWTPKFVEDLKGGLRLTQPHLATNAIFEKMFNCWDKEPSERPCFSSLKAFFAGLTEEQYITL